MLGRCWHHFKHHSGRGVNGPFLLSQLPPCHTVFRKCTNIPRWAPGSLLTNHRVHKVCVRVFVCVCLHTRTQPLASQHILYPAPVFLLSVSAAFYLWSVACMSWNAAIPLPQRIQPPSRPHAYLTLRTNRWAEAQSSVQRLWNSQMEDDAPSVCPHSLWPGSRGIQQRLWDIKTNGNVDTKIGCASAPVCIFITRLNVAFFLHKLSAVKVGFMFPRQVSFS